MPAAMMKRESFPIANIYVPTKRRATLNPKTVDEIAESILQARPTHADPGPARRRPFRPGGRPAPARSLQEIGRSNDLRLSGRRAKALEHDPEKACPGLDPGWEPVLGKARPRARPEGSCSNKKLESDAIQLNWIRLLGLGWRRRRSSARDYRQHDARGMRAVVVDGVGPHQRWMVGMREHPVGGRRVAVGELQPDAVALPEHV